MPSGKGRFEGKCVVVTGASTGLGAATAHAFAREGARVGLVARRADHLGLVALELRGQGGDGVPFPADLREIAELPGLVDQIVSRLGTVDVLVNAAGSGRQGPLELWSHEELAEIITLNLTVPVALTRLVLPHMKHHGGGAIISVAARAACFSGGGETPYSATKLALQAFTFALAEELEAANVRVSVVSPSAAEDGAGRADVEMIPGGPAWTPSLPTAVAATVLACADDVWPDRRATPAN